MVLAAAAIATSCSVVMRSTYSPDRTQLNISMADLVLVGETEISVEYDTYLGIFTSIGKVNGEPYDHTVQNYTSLHSNTILARKLNIAAHKVLEDFPQANYFVVTNQTVTKEVLFLGSERTVKATVKAYKIK